MSDKYDEAIRKGKHAEVLLDDSLLNEALDVLERNAVKAMLECPASDVLEARCVAAAVEKLRRTLRTYLDDAKIAAKTIER